MDLPRLRNSHGSSRTTTRPLSPPPTSCPLGPIDESDAENEIPSISVISPRQGFSSPDRRNACREASNTELEATPRQQSADPQPELPTPSTPKLLRSPPPTGRRRDKRAPTVTPRRLAKFFHPRTRAQAQSRALQELPLGSNNVSSRLLAVEANEDNNDDDDHDGHNEGTDAAATTLGTLHDLGVDLGLRQGLGSLERRKRSSSPSGDQPTAKKRLDDKLDEETVAKRRTVLLESSMELTEGPSSGLRPRLSSTLRRTESTSSTGSIVGLDGCGHE